MDIESIFKWMADAGCDKGFEPKQRQEFEATQARIGSREKVEAMARRVEKGLPLWHSEDWPASHPKSDEEQ